MRQLRSRVDAGMGQPPMHQPPPPLQQIPQQPLGMYPDARDPYTRPLPLRQEPRAELPPLSSISAPMQPPPEAMSGVTYQVDPSAGTQFGSRPSTSNYQGPARH
jgi:hypothetical protein